MFYVSFRGLVAHRKVKGEPLEIAQMLAKNTLGDSQMRFVMITRPMAKPHQGLPMPEALSRAASCFWGEATVSRLFYEKPRRYVHMKFKNFKNHLTIVFTQKPGRLRKTATRLITISPKACVSACFVSLGGPRSAQLFMIVVTCITVTPNQLVSLSGFEIFLHHLRHQLLKGHLGRPTELSSGLGGVPK